MLNKRILLIVGLCMFVLSQRQTVPAQADQVEHNTEEHRQQPLNGRCDTGLQNCLNEEEIADQVAAMLTRAVERVSVTDDGEEGFNDSFAPDISADGRFVVFASEAENLANNDNNNVQDIFIHDRNTNDTDRVSLSSDGEEGNFASYAPAVSDDGRFVVFHSFAFNLVEGDTNNVPDVFLHDTETQETVLISSTGVGPGNDASFDPDISGDGRYIFFWSEASDLVTADTNGTADIFRYDREDDIMSRASIDSNGEQANGSSRYPRATADGNRVVFESDASNLVGGDSGVYLDIFTHTFGSGTTHRVSIGPDNEEANGDSTQPYFAPGGTYVVFRSLASNLVEDDDNNAADIFFVRGSGTEMERISVATDEDEANGPSAYPSLSADSRYVVFRSKATNLDEVDEIASRNIFIRDREAGTTRLVNLNDNDELANDESWEPRLAADGRFITYRSEADNLVADDNNGDDDIFVYDLQVPDPVLEINFEKGRPGSTFILTGENLPAEETVTVYVNQQLLLPQISSDEDGELSFQLHSQAITQEGRYSVRVTVGSFTMRTHFYLDFIYSLRDDTNSSPIYELPTNIAYDEAAHLPLLADD